MTNIQNDEIHQNNNERYTIHVPSMVQNYRIDKKKKIQTLIDFTRVQIYLKEIEKITHTSHRHYIDD